jgi:hypothetical protein
MSSCGDSVFALEGSDAAVAVGAVAVGDVVSDGALGGVPVAVVGVVEDELLDRAEVALDPVEVAGVGGVGTSSIRLAAANARMSGVQFALRLSWIQ